MSAQDKPLGMSERAVLDCIARSTHWPMECSLTPAALEEVETAIRARLNAAVISPRVRAELSNLANNIRAHLQHVIAERAEPTDEDLLA